MSIRSAYKRPPLVSQPIRTFRSLDLASNFIERITVHSNISFRFNIQQTASGWVVSRVISGGAQ